MAITFLPDMQPTVTVVLQCELLPHERTKRCSVCGQLRAVALFISDVRRKDGKDGTCRVCRNEKKKRRYAAQAETRAYFKRRHIRRTYGLSVTEYDAMVAAQDGKCAVCLVTLSLGKSTHVDHCHDTGKIRGVLCHGCNTCLGHAGDDPVRLRALAEYVERHRVYRAL